MKSGRTAAAAPLLVAFVAAAASAANVTAQRTPDGGIQPQVVVNEGTIHLLYFKGEDTYLLASPRPGADFTSTRVAPWTVGMCVMSTTSFLQTRQGVLMAYERGVGRQGGVFACGGSRGQWKRGPDPKQIQINTAPETHPSLRSPRGRCRLAFACQRRLPDRPGSLL